MKSSTATTIAAAMTTSIANAIITTIFRINMFIHSFLVFLNAYIVPNPGSDVNSLWLFHQIYI
jgi:hypothetical protein